MEFLKSLMQSVDDISHTIPDGTYLEMCNNLKSIHELIPKVSDPPVTDNRSIPFQVVNNDTAGNESESESDSDSESESDDDHDHDHDDRSWSPEWYDEWKQNEGFLIRLMADMRFADSQLKILKPIQRTVKKVKEAAIKEYCEGFYNVPSLSAFTFQNLINSPEWADVLRVSTGEQNEYFKSKDFEKELYNDYKSVQNLRIESRASSMRELKRNLDVEIDNLRERQNFLQSNYNL